MCRTVCCRRCCPGASCRPYPKCALRDEIPEFKEFFEARPWEKKPESEEENKEDTEEDGKNVPEENTEAEEVKTVSEPLGTETSDEEITENISESEEA
jgi:hypothetical protein